MGCLSIYYSYIDIGLYLHTFLGLKKFKLKRYISKKLLLGSEIVQWDENVGCGGGDGGDGSGDDGSGDGGGGWVRRNHIKIDNF